MGKAIIQYSTARALLFKADQSHCTVTLLLGMANRHYQFSFVVENCVRQPLIWIVVEVPLRIKEDEAVSEVTARRAQADDGLEQNFVLRQQNCSVIYFTAGKAIGTDLQLALKTYLPAVGRCVPAIG